MEKESSHNVRVMIRFRPERDIETHTSTAKKFSVKFGEDEKSVRLTQNEPGKSSVQRSYTFDRVFGPSATQEYVFKNLAMTTIDDVVNGFNGTIFAYGQTGSGKTHSMFGPSDGRSSSELRGIIPRSAEYLFSELDKAEDIRQVTIKCSFMEIYKERVRDLLNANNEQPLKIRETPRGAVRVVGLLEEYVSSPADILKLIARGHRVRSVSRTDMNEYSSRSHTLLTITVTSKTDDNAIRVGKLNLADLAGSERADKSALQGSTLSEAKKINQSLSALGNCINALTDNKRSHVPFRDSRLTYVLKDSLGGNTKTSLLVTCSPHAVNSDETLSSLTFAQRASHVKNNVRINKQLSVNELQDLVSKLRKQLSDSRARIKQMQKEAKKGNNRGAIDYDYDDEPDMNMGNTDLRYQTLPTDPEKTAEMYAAFGNVALEMNQQEQKTYARRATKGKKVQNNTLPSGPLAFTDMSFQHPLDRAAFPHNFPGAVNIMQTSSRAHSGRAAEAHALRESYDIEQKMVDGLELLQEFQGVEEEFSKHDVHRTRGDMAGQHDVMQRAKDAIRRSLASRQTAAPLDEDSEDSDFYDRERQKEKARLRQQLEAAKAKRESIRSESRSKIDLWAAQALDGDDAHAQEERAREFAALKQRARAKLLEKEKKDKKKKKKKKKKKHGSDSDSTDEDTSLQSRRPAALRNTKLDIASLADDGQRTPDEWSPVHSPIPPPPSYPYPITPRKKGEPMLPVEDDGSLTPPPPPEATKNPWPRLGKKKAQNDEAASTLPEAYNEANNPFFKEFQAEAARASDDMRVRRQSTNSKDRSRQVRRNQRLGNVEFRIDLLPKFSEGFDASPTSLGHVEVGDHSMLLTEFRKVIRQEIDDLPQNFIFTRKNVPIGVRQEKKRAVSYIASPNDVIYIRVDETMSN